MFIAPTFGCPATEEKRVAKMLGNVATVLPAQKEYSVQESLHESKEFCVQKEKNRAVQQLW